MKKKIKSLINNNKGFTLIELIVVVAIIAVLVAILVPRITGLVTESRQTAQLSTASTIWSNAQLAIAIADKGDGTSEEQFKNFFSNDAIVDTTSNEDGLFATVEMSNGDVYTVTKDDEDNFIVSLEGSNIQYPIETDSSNNPSN